MDSCTRRPVGRALRLGVLVWVALLLAPAGPARAQGQQLELKADEEALLDLSGDPQDADDTAVRIRNLSSETGVVSVDFDPQAGLGPQDTVTEGFALVDGTLIVSSSIPPGELRVRYRIEAGARALGRAGIRAGRARMLRRDARTGRWRPAIQALQGRAQGRYLRDARADFVLGHHGFSQQDEYVWAVLDVNSRYAAGGETLQVTPLPLLGTLGLVGLGLALCAAAFRLRSPR